MQRCIQILSCAAVLVLLTLTVFATQEGRGPRLDELRQRWESLTPEQQQNLRERWERLQKMPDSERTALMDNARALAAVQRRIESKLTPEQRARWDALSAERKRELMREMFQGIGSRMRDRLPPEMVERMRHAPPQERGRLSSEAKQRLVEAYVRERGLPEGVSAERWAQIQALPPEEFLAATREHFRKNMERSGPPHGERRGPPSETERRGPPSDRGPGPRWGPMSAEHERSHRLREACHPQPGDLIDFADLDPQTRRARVQERVRERALKLLAEGQLPASEIERLRALPQEEFERELRKWTGGPGPGSGERRGPPRKQPKDG
jgi:Protein of unknown function (DUF3106)